jgi:hypothetical protein
LHAKSDVEVWKLGWCLRDFLYDPKLLAHEQVAKKGIENA